MLKLLIRSFMTSRASSASQALGWRLFAWLTFALALAAIAGLLHAAWCALTWCRFCFDYGSYTNMTWNSGHGDPFRLLVTSSYLKTHLSFSLGLLGFLYHLWDHPFLLALVQNLALLGGVGFLLAAGRRLGLSLPVLASVTFFYSAYIFTQRVMLCEFHGVGMYYLLVPWLYYCLRFARKWAILPLALLLGIREDAFLFLLPLLAHSAWRDRWRPGYALLGFTVIYGILAITVLFPAINGFSVLARRQESLATDRLLGTWQSTGLQLRLRALGLTVLPMTPFLSRRCLPLWLYPSVALATCLLSGFWRQHGLLNHYSAPVMTMLTIGLLESMSRQPKPMMAKDARAWRGLILVLLTLAVHFGLGFLPGGPRNDLSLRYPHPLGLLLIQTAQHAPKPGILVTTDRLAPVVANRRDILPWSLFDPKRHQVDLLLDSMSHLPGVADGVFMAALSNGTYGAVYFNQEFLLLQTNAPTGKNAELLRRINHRRTTIPVADTAAHHGSNLFEPKVGWVKHWSGNGSRAPANLSYGGNRSLAPGRYQALIHHRTQAPRRNVRNSWGVFTLRILNSPHILAEASVEETPTLDGHYRIQRIPFTLDKTTSVEFQATGMDAPLWLDRVVLVPDESN